MAANRQAQGWRISVDTGGTFTDVVVADDAGHFTIGKALTTPGRIYHGLEAALETAAARVVAGSAAANARRRAQRAWFSAQS